MFTKNNNEEIKNKKDIWKNNLNIDIKNFLIYINWIFASILLLNNLVWVFQWINFWSINYLLLFYDYDFNKTIIFSFLYWLYIFFSIWLFLIKITWYQIKQKKSFFCRKQTFDFETICSISCILILWFFILPLFFNFSKKDIIYFVENTNISTSKESYLINEENEEKKYVYYFWRIFNNTKKLNEYVYLWKYDSNNFNLSLKQELFEKRKNIIKDLSNWKNIKTYNLEFWTWKTKYFWYKINDNFENNENLYSIRGEEKKFTNFLWHTILNYKKIVWFNDYNEEKNKIELFSNYVFNINIKDITNSWSENEILKNEYEKINWEFNQIINFDWFKNNSITTLNKKLILLLWEERNKNLDFSKIIEWKLKFEKPEYYDNDFKTIDINTTWDSNFGIAISNEDIWNFETGILNYNDYLKIYKKIKDRYLLINEYQKQIENIKKDPYNNVF